MDTVETLRNYIKLMVANVNGAKVLLLDPFTKRLLSLIYGHSEILKHDILLIDLINNELREIMSHLKCIVFVRPNQKNALCIKQELMKPKYKQYYLFFSNILEEDILQTISDADKKELVQSVKEFYCDYTAPDSFAFSLDIRSSVPFYFNYKENLFNRACEGLFSSVLSLSEEKPFIRYQITSRVCKRIARALNSKLSEERNYKLFPKQRPTSTVVLIFDRRSDPITPLLHQWTYQAMVHELIGKAGIVENIIFVKKSENEDDDEKDQKGGKKTETLFSALNDEFLKDNMLKNWGDLCVEIKKLVDRYKNHVKSKDNINSIEDIRNFISNYSEFNKLNREVNNHIDIVYELKDIIKKRKLLQVSKLEQEIVNSGENIKENYHKLIEILSTKIYKRDAIKLCLIYLLRYESHSNNNIKKIIHLLKEQGFKKEDLDILNGILMYGGEKIRKTKNLFPEITKGIKGIFQRVKSALKDVENVFTQHTPLIMKLVDELYKGELSEKLYPYQALKLTKKVPKKVFVFVVGGFTYEELKCVIELNREFMLEHRKDRKLFLGGTRILNSKSFLQEVSGFQKQKETSMYPNMLSI